MEFRPCIDIHNGKVKQIVGGSLRDQGDLARENYVSDKDAAFYAKLYRRHALREGHIVLLNSRESDYYEASREMAMHALSAFPGGMQIGGGIDIDNAQTFLQAGASHVIVTSYVFREGRILYDRLAALKETVGKEHLVLDLSCRRVDNSYRVVTDRWQTITKERVTDALLDELSRYCSEFLIHGVDVEGKRQGIEEKLVALLGAWDGIPVTYAGGIHSFADLELLYRTGNGRVNATIGSALDLFGGSLPFDEVLQYFDHLNSY